MVLGAPVFAGNDAIKNFQHFPGLHDQAGLFAGFALRGRAEGFSQFYHSSRQRPLAQQGRRASLHQYNTSGMDDHSAHADDGPVRVFAFHCGVGVPDEFEEVEKNARGRRSINFHAEPACSATKLSVASLCSGAPPFPVSASICTSTLATPWPPFMPAFVRLKCMRMASVCEIKDVICSLKSWPLSILLRSNAARNLPAERVTSPSFIRF